MGKTREYQFITGIESSTIPDPGTPSADNDTISLGFINDKSFWAEPVADYAAMRALLPAKRASEQVRRVTATVEIWYFDSASTATDDGVGILKPTDLGGGDPGRWLIHPGGSGSGGGGGGGGIEPLIQKAENERFREFTDPLDNSICMSGAQSQFIAGIEGNLIEDSASTDTTLIVSWDTKFLSDSDKNVDSATSWAVGSAGATLTTSATRKVGSLSLSFDKDGSATTAYIEFDRASANLSLNSNSTQLFWINLPSITQLTNVFVTLLDASSNSRTWSITTNEAGGALATGWNLISVDLSNTTGTTTGGSGVTIATALRYVRIGVTTSVAGQTYTAILVDGPWFSARYANQYGFTGAVLTLFNNSTKENTTIDISNTRNAGTLTVAAGIANSYVAGFSNTDRARLKRTLLVASGGDQYAFNNDAGLSGTVTTTQTIRASTILRGTVSGSVETFVDAYPVQSYPVSSVSGSDALIEDGSDQHLNLLSGNTVDVFEPKYSEGETTYVLRGTTTLSGNSTHSSGTTTCPLTTIGSISAGDILCKRHISSAKFGVSSLAANETPGTMTAKTTPDGVQLVNMGANYPKRENVYGHWFLGAESSTDALRNRRGVGVALTATGSPTYSASFFKSRFAASNLNASNYFSMSISDSNDLSGSSEDVTTMSLSLWVYLENDGTQRSIIGRAASAVGWAIVKNTSNQIEFWRGNGGTFVTTTGPTVSTPGWYNIIANLQDVTATTAFVNGVQYNLTGSQDIQDSGTVLNVGGTISGFSASSATMRFGELVIWRNNVALTQTEADIIYNGGNFNPIGVAPIQRYRYTNTGQSGQRLMVELDLTRSTTAVTPILSKFGAIIV